MKKIRQIFRNKVLILISLIAYRFSLDFLYVNEVAELWDYQHFEFHRDNIAYIISILWFCIIAWRENRIVNQKQASSIFEFLLNLLFFIPFSSYIGLSGSTTQFVFYSILYWLILTISFMYFRKNGKPKKKIYTNINVNDKGPIRVPSLFIKIAVPIVVINFFSTIYYNGLSFNISFDEIYDIRLAAREIKMPTILSYLKPISTPVLMILLIISIVNRKKLYTILLLFAQFENFAFGALKGDLFIMLLAVCIALFYRTGRNYYFLYAIKNKAYEGAKYFLENFDGSQGYFDMDINELVQILFSQPSSELITFARFLVKLHIDPEYSYDKINWTDYQIGTYLNITSKIYFVQ